MEKAGGWAEAIGAGFSGAWGGDINLGLGPAPRRARVKRKKKRRSRKTRKKRRTHRTTIPKSRGRIIIIPY